VCIVHCKINHAARYKYPNNSISKMISKIYKTLLKRYDKQGWWPITPPGHVEPVYDKGPRTAKQKLEVCFGAILTQNTSWKNVEKAIVNLNKHDLIEINKILRIPKSQLAQYIKPSGYFNQKAIKLKSFCQYIKDNYQSSLELFFEKTIKTLRRELLSIHGIGPETADSIILYAAAKPSFVVDTYTKRILSRYGSISKKASYDEIKELFESQFGKNSQVYNEYHALIVKLAKTHCLAKYPTCSSCPLTKGCKKDY